MSVSQNFPPLDVINETLNNEIIMYTFSLSVDLFIYFLKI